MRWTLLVLAATAMAKPLSVPEAADAWILQRLAQEFAGTNDVTPEEFPQVLAAAVSSTTPVASSSTGTATTGTSSDPATDSSTAVSSTTTTNGRGRIAPVPAATPTTTAPTTTTAAPTTSSTSPSSSSTGGFSSPPVGPIPGQSTSTSTTSSTSAAAPTSTSTSIPSVQPQQSPSSSSSVVVASSSTTSTTVVASSSSSTIITSAPVTPTSSAPGVIVSGQTISVGGVGTVGSEVLTLPTSGQLSAIQTGSITGIPYSALGANLALPTQAVLGAVLPALAFAAFA